MGENVSVQGQKSQFKMKGQPVTKDHICMTPLIQDIQDRQIYRDRNTVSGWQGWKEGGMGAGS